MLKRIIFDIDGTLIKNTNFYNEIEKVLYKYGLYSKENATLLDMALGTYEQHYNNYNEEDYLKYINSVLNIKLDKSFLEDLLNGFVNVLDEDNLTEVLKYLSKKYELVVLSNYFKKSQLERLKKMKMDKYFLDFYGEKMIKPNKEAYIMACGNKKPDECLMIGDNLELDVKIPISLGLEAIWFSPNDNIEELGIKKINDLRQLKELL